MTDLNHPDLFSDVEDAADDAQGGPTTLREWIAAQPVDEARVKDTGLRLLQFLADRGGFALAHECRRAGYGDAAILPLLAEPKDKRQRPKAAAGLVEGEEVVWLLPGGWKAIGAPVKKQVESLPTGEHVKHASAPREFRKWLVDRASVLGEDELSIDVLLSSHTINSLSESAKALAWSRIQGGAGDASGGVGALTSGFRPDAVVCERWWNPALYAQAYGKTDPPAHLVEEAAEVLWALEIEDSVKSQEPLRAKIERLDAARTLGVIHGTIWVTRTTAVARALAQFGIGRDSGAQREGHVAVRSWQVGLGSTPGGPLVPGSPSRWWPLLLPRPKPVAVPTSPFVT